MSTQFLLNEDDIKELTKLMLVMIETQESRKQLCRELGINPQEVSFIIGTSDDTFCTELIDCLNRYGYQEYLCKLCYEKLFPILNKSVYSHRISILEKIVEKLNCNCNFNHDSENNFPQEQIRKQPTPVRINRKQFLFWVGLGGASLVTAVVGYEIFNNPSFTPEKKYTPDEQIYTIVTSGGSDSGWRISMEGNSAALGTRAITNWTQRVERNSEFKLIYKRTNNAYEIRPRVETNGDACLTTFPNGFLSLNKCDDTLYQNFAIDCEKKDITGNLSECYILNKGTNKPIGTEWDNPDKSNKPNIESKNYTSDNARWWSFVVLDKR